MFRPRARPARQPGAAARSAEGEWDALVERVRRSKGTVLDQPRDPGRRHARAGGAGGGRPRPARDPRRLHRPRPRPPGARRSGRSGQAPAGHALPRFLRRIQAPGSSSPRPVVLAGPGTARRARAVEPHLPPERVHVVTVPQPGAPHGELWRRFCRPSASTRAWAPGGQRRAATPRSASPRARCCASSTAGCARAGLAHGDYRTPDPRPGRARDPGQPPRRRNGWRCRRSSATGPRRSARPGSSGSSAPASTSSATSTTCARSGPIRETEKRDPDRVRQRKIADAALDALVAMIEEAARRDDPDEHARSKPGHKAARRLRGGDR